MVKKIFNVKVFVFVAILFVVQLFIGSNMVSAARLSAPTDIYALTYCGEYTCSIEVNWISWSSGDYYEVEADGVRYVVKNRTYFKDTGLQSSSTHSYRVRAKNYQGESSNWTSTIYVTTSPTIPRVINTKLKLDAITIEWANCIGAETYDIEINGERHTVSSNIYKVKNLRPNEKISYKIRAYCYLGGYSDWTDYTVARTLLMSSSDIQTTSKRRSISISFKSIPGAERYVIEDASGNYIGETTSTVFENKSLEPSTTYSYRIRVYGQSNPSEVIYATTHGEYYSQYLYVPSVSATLQTSKDVLCTFTADILATEYDVEKDGTVIGQAAVYSYTPEVKYSDIGFDNTITHKYRFRAVSDNSVGGWSDYVVVLGIPNIKVSQTETSYNMITWNSIPDTDQYQLYIDGNIITLNTTTYKHEVLKDGAVHSYGIMSIGSNKMSSWSEEVKTLETPKNIKIEPYWLKTKASLSWDAVPGAESYDIMIDGIVYYNTKDTLYDTGFGWPFCSYDYKIRARNAHVEGEWSQVIRK